MGGQVEKWLKGWDDDDDVILSACADDFVYDDPYDGRMDKAEFAEYFLAIPDGEWLDSDFVAQEVDGPGDPLVLVGLEAQGSERVGDRRLLADEGGAGRRPFVAAGLPQGGGLPRGCQGGRLSL